MSFSSAENAEIIILQIGINAFAAFGRVFADNAQTDLAAVFEYTGHGILILQIGYCGLVCADLPYFAFDRLYKI